MDSTNWDHVPLRDSDVLVITHAKSGTTWTQQIMWQLVNGGKENPADYDQIWHSPWVDMIAVPPPPVKAKWINSLPDRRVLKSHMPLDALPWNSNTRYIYIGRDGRDVIMSLFNHHNSLTDALRGMLNVGPALEFAPFFDAFLTGSVYWDWFSHIVSYWKYRHLSNLLLVHYNDLKADSRAGIKRIAKFCNIVLDEKQLDNVVEHSSFDWMKKHEHLFSPPPFLFAEGQFVYKGTNQRWKEVMTPEQLRRYDETCKKWFEPDLIAWINRA